MGIRNANFGFKVVIFLMIMFVAFMVVMLLLTVIGATKAHAHSWYSTYCCTGKDCAEIPSKAVTIGKEGYKIHLTPADHPSINTTFDYTVPQLKAYPSEDSEYHACILPDTPDVMRCLYVPNMGF